MRAQSNDWSRRKWLGILAQPERSTAINGDSERTQYNDGLNTAEITDSFAWATIAIGGIDYK